MVDQYTHRSDMVKAVYDTNNDGEVDSAAGITGVTSTPTELNLLDGSSTANDTASTAVILDSNKLIQTAANVGTVGTNVTAVEYGDGKHHTTVLTLSGVSYTIAGAANEAVGALVYTFPAGVHSHRTTYMSVNLQGGGTVDADTPDVGLGSVIATGAVAVLSGTATFEDYITGQTATDVGGTAIIAHTAATAGYGTGISLNASGDAKTLHLNLADGWAGADTITATGTIVIEWVDIA